MRSLTSHRDWRVLVAWTLSALAVAALAAWRVDVARDGGIKGDEATFVAMAGSVAYDGDLTYTASDYRRMREWYGSGPEGIFLKRDTGGGLYFGKAYLYGIVAAPFARAGLRGLLFFNLFCLIVTIAAGIWWLAPGSRSAAAIGYSALFAVAAITPLYSAWLTAEVLNYALVFLAFVIAWPRTRTDAPSGARVWIGAALLAAAAFSKPLNVLLIVPFALGTASTRRRRAVVLAGAGAMMLAFFFANAALMGEMNYQGGDRKVFYTHFPYDESGGAYESLGIAITTNTVQTPVGEEGRLTHAPANAWYFLAGRHFGLIPFGWPWLVSVLLWLVAQPDKRLAEWLLLGAVGATAAATIIWMPYTWSGGGGPVGNRYFLSIAAALFVLTPRLRSVVPAAVAALGLIFVTPAFASPFEVAKQPWRATRASMFKLLPLELTGASDFPVILDQRRGRVPQGHQPTVFVAFIDAAADVGDNGWMAIRDTARSELLVRSPEPLESIVVGVKSPAACNLTIADGRHRETVPIGAGERRDTSLRPDQVFSRDSFVFVLSVDATRCSAPVQLALQGVRPTQTASEAR